MKNFKLSAFLTFLFLGSTFVSAQRIAEEAFMKIRIERIIGLTMLNEVGNHIYENLPVLFFNLPDAVRLRTYSYRANKSIAPDDYVAGLSAVDKPMLVLMGSEDEAFSSIATKEAVLKNSNERFIRLTKIRIMA